MSNVTPIRPGLTPSAEYESTLAERLHLIELTIESARAIVCVAEQALDPMRDRESLNCQQVRDALKVADGLLDEAHNDLDLEREKLERKGGVA